jgi:hypothetical protein
MAERQGQDSADAVQGLVIKTIAAGHRSAPPVYRFRDHEPIQLTRSVARMSSILVQVIVGGLLLGGYAFSSGLT